jgi:hypothetical protein
MRQFLTRIMSSDTITRINPKHFIGIWAITRSSALPGVLLLTAQSGIDDSKGNILQGRRQGYKFTCFTNDYTHGLRGERH